MGWFSSFNNSLSASFAKVREDTTNLFRWVTWLKARGDVQQRKLSHLEGSQDKAAKDVSDLQNENLLMKRELKQMMDYMRLVHKEVVELHTEVHKPALPEAAVEAVQEIPKIVAVASDGLTEAENVFLSHLYHAPKPLSYEEISKALHLNYGTIKNRLNKVKAKGIDIQFEVDDSGERRFYLPETVKIRLSGR